MQAVQDVAYAMYLVPQMRSGGKWNSFFQDIIIPADGTDENFSCAPLVLEMTRITGQSRGIPRRIEHG